MTPLNLGAIQDLVNKYAPVVYLNGTALFVAGLAIVQIHNRWARNWTVLVTLAGWVLLAGGLYRMVAPTAPQLGRGTTTYVLLAVLIATGGLLTFKGYAPTRRGRGQS